MKLKIGLSFFVSFLFLNGQILLAQTNSTADSMRLEHVDVFSTGTDLAGRLPRSSRPEVMTRWILKCNPVALGRGQLPVYVERRIHAKYSLEAALGITFEDYFKSIFLQGKQAFQKDPKETHLSGITAKLALRYFPRGTALSGLYFSPEMDWTNYRKDIQGVYLQTDNTYANGSLRDQQKYIDFKALLGYQTLESGDSDISMDWYVGIGLRAGEENNVVLDERNANVIKLSHGTVYSPVIAIGIKLGLGF
jgi:hypothetical protein